MNSAVLDNMKEVAAEIAVSYTNGRVDAMLRGANKYRKLQDDSMRVIYLWGLLNYAYLDGSTVYIGGTAVTDAYIQEAWNKLNHYKGYFQNVDLTDYSTIVADDGEGGAVAANESNDQTGDHYRSGNIPVVTGVNYVTFVKNGVASPLASADYTVQAYAIGDNGYRQNNVVITGLVAGGFIASDVLRTGTLYYSATLNT